MFNEVKKKNMDLEKNNLDDLKSNQKPVSKSWGIGRVLGFIVGNIVGFFRKIRG